MTVQIAWSPLRCGNGGVTETNVESPTKISGTFDLTNAAPGTWSVKVTNIAELMEHPDIDGALVGGASLEPDEFARIVQYGEGS